MGLQHPRTGLTPLRAAEAHGQLAVALLLKVSTKRAPAPSVASVQPTSKEARGDELPRAPPSAESTPTPEPEPAASTAPPVAPTTGKSGKKGDKKKRDKVVDVSVDLAAVD